MKMTVTNKKLQIGDVTVISVGPTSILLIGDTETLTCSFYFDTPADSLIFDPRVPFRGKEREIGDLWGKRKKPAL